MALLTLLIVEDEDEIRHELQNKLQEAGYEVTAFFDSPAVLRYVQDYGLPHLAVIDIDLPSTMDGLELSAELKDRGDVPIIFLTGQKEEEDIIRGLKKYKADDYVTKPFSYDELLARIERVLSRIPNFDYVTSPVYKLDTRSSVDFGNSRLLITGEKGTKAVMLTPIEASLLYILMRFAEHVVSSDMLIARVWPNEEIYEDTLRVNIHRLRRKLEIDYRNPQYILTVRGEGYRFVMPTGQETE